MPTPVPAPPAGPCPCGFGEPYAACCGRLHRGEAAAATAEALMRSRYSAFAVHDEAHLLRTWHPRTRPARVGADPDLVWTHLEVLATAGGGPFDAEGTVEFRAHHRRGRSRGAVHERSRFVREGGRWFYVGADG